MDKPEFTLGVQRVIRNFNHAPIKQDVVDEWFSRLNTIPRREWEYIIDRIIDDEEIFPRNFKKTVWAKYHEARAHFGSGRIEVPEGVTHEEANKNLDALKRLMDIYSIGSREEKDFVLGLTAAMYYTTDAHEKYDPMPESTGKMFTREEVVKHAAAEIREREAGKQTHGLLDFIFGGGNKNGKEAKEEAVGFEEDNIVPE